MSRFVWTEDDSSLWVCRVPHGRRALGYVTLSRDGRWLSRVGMSGALLEALSKDAARANVETALRTATEPLPIRSKLTARDVDAARGANPSAKARIFATKASR